MWVVGEGSGDVSLKMRVGGEVKRMVVSDLLEEVGSCEVNLKGGGKSRISVKVGGERIVVESGCIGGWEEEVRVDGELRIG